MRIACCGDQHYRVTKPEFRTDDFVAAQYFKTEWELQTVEALECSVVLMPGDIFDHPKLPYHLTQQYIRLFKTTTDKGIKILTVFGQHDLRYHAFKVNTPLYTMDAAGVIQILGPIPITIKGVNFYGANWEEEIPEPILTSGFNICLMHKMVIIEDPLFPGQKDFTFSNHLFVKNPNIDLFVTGDNHQTFIIMHQHDRMLINAGSMMRTRIDQVNHKPCVFIYDTDNRTAEQDFIPIKDGVFDMGRALRRKEKDKKLKAWVNMVDKKEEITGLKFEQNLSTYLKENNEEQGVIDMINKEILNDPNSTAARHTRDTG
jgi:DNA repair exonuclease SbcCD nuclease subunit